MQMALGEGDVSFSTIMKNIGFLMKNLPFAKKKAEKHLKETIAQSEERGGKGMNGQALFALGRLYMGTKRPAEARQCISKAIKVFEHCEIETYKRQAQDALASLN